MSVSARSSLRSSGVRASATLVTALVQKSSGDAVRGFLGSQPEARIQRLRVRDAHALAAREIVGLGIAVHERADRHVEFGQVAARQIVALGNAHGAGLAVAAVGKAQRAHAPSDVALVRLEHRDAVAATLELVRRHETRQACAHHDDRQGPRRVGGRRQGRQRGLRGARTRQGHQAAQELAPGTANAPRRHDSHGLPSRCALGCSPSGRPVGLTRERRCSASRAGASGARLPGTACRGRDPRRAPRRGCGASPRCAT